MEEGAQNTEEENLLLLKNKQYDEWLTHNMKLLHYFAQKYFSILKDYDETLSIIYVATTKAFNCFDFNRNIKFATFLSQLILNELLMEKRKNKKSERFQTCSLQEILYNEKQEEMRNTREDYLASSTNIEEEYIQKEAVANISEAIKALSYQKKQVIQMTLENKKQKDICDKLNLSQSYVSRLYRQATQDIKKIISHKSKKAVFRMNKKKNNQKSDSIDNDNVIKELAKTQNININYLAYSGIKDDYVIYNNFIMINDKYYTYDEFNLLIKEFESLKTCIEILQKEELLFIS